MALSRRSAMVLGALGLLAFSSASPAWAAREGFGMKRALVEIARVRPAEVVIPGTRIWVRGEAQDPACSAPSGLLSAQLASEVLSADPRLSSDEVQADAVIEVKVLRCDYEETWENRQVIKVREAGKDQDGKPIYKSYEETVRYQVVTATLAIAYSATARRTGANLDSDSLEVDFREDYAEGAGALGRPEIESRLVGQLVGRIVPRLAATSEVIRVLLPKGSLETLIPLAEGGLWNRYLEALEREPERPSPIDESYRRYAIGLAYEVLGYLDQDPQTTLDYLGEAYKYYDQALGLNPGEKYFSQPFEGSWAAKAGKGAGLAVLGVLRGESVEAAKPAESPPPIKRVEAALTRYRLVISQREQLASLTGGESIPSGGKSLENGGGSAFGNDQVIDMVHAGLAQEIVVQAIKDTAACRFDLSPQGLIQLSKAQVPAPVIQVMQTAPCVKSHSG